MLPETLFSWSTSLTRTGNRVNTSSLGFLRFRQGASKACDSSIAIMLMGKRELVALFNLSSWCLVMVEPLFVAVPWGCLQFVIVVFPDHTHYFYWVWGGGGCN